MRDSGIVYPLTLQLNEGSITSEGPYIFTTTGEPSYTVRLNRIGESVNYNSSEGIAIRVVEGTLGGVHFVRQSPPNDGYMPRAMSYPFQVMVDDDGYTNNWMGHTTPMVREYLPPAFDNGLGINYGSANSIRQGRLFEYRGELYYVAQTKIWTVAEYEFIVTVYKWSEEEQAFVILKTFSQNPVNVDYDYSYLEFQDASPDVVVFEDNVYVIYKQYNGTDNEHTIRCYKSIDQDLTEWSLVSSFVIENPITDTFQDFTLRCAANEDTIMVATYMYSSEEREVGLFIPKHDLRTYITSDGAKTWKTRNNYSSGISLDDSGQGIVGTNASSNLAEIFIPNVDYDDSGHSALIQSGVQIYSTSFALYYDKNMGSFVIMKSGGPQVSNDNVFHLMAIKTSDSFFLRWELCLDHIVDNSVTGITENTSTDFDPFAIQDNIVEYANSYYLTDVEVIPGETRNYLLFCSRLLNDTYGFSTAYSGAGLTEFSFVSDSQIPNGIYDKVFAYGGKYHDTYSFVGTLINHDQNGLICTGNPTAGNFSTTYNISGCMLRGQLVASFYYLTNPNVDGFQYNKISPMTIMLPWQNVDEGYGYQYAYSSWVGDIENWDMSAVTASGTAEYDEVNYINLCTAPFVGDTAYYTLVKDASANTPSIVERVCLDPNLYFKIRCRLTIDGGGNDTVSVAQVVVKDDTSSGYEFTVKIINSISGNITFQLIINGNVYTQASQFLTDSEFEFVAGICKGRSGTTKAWLLEKIDDTCNVLINEDVVVAPLGSLNPAIKVGIVEMLASNTGGTVIGIKEVQVSSYDSGYRPTFSGDYRYMSGYAKSDAGGLFPTVTDQLDDYTYAPTVEMFSNELELPDGSVIELYGSDLEINSVHQWLYERGLGSNSSRNVVNYKADHSYDFTNTYIYAPVGQESYCHCYYEQEKLTYDQDRVEGKMILFDNESMHQINAFSLININGIHCFELMLGTASYNAGFDSFIWTEREIIHYSVPRIELEGVTVVNKKIMFTNDLELPDGYLINHDIMVYDTVNRKYVQKATIKEHYDSFIETNTVIVFNEAFDYHILHNAHSFEIPAPYSENVYQNVAIKFYCADLTDLNSIGEIVFGRFVSLSEYINDVEINELSMEKVFNTDFGYTFNSSHDEGNVVEEHSVSMRVLNNRDFKKLKDMTFGLYNSRLNIPIIYQHSDGYDVTHYGVVNGIDVKNNGYVNEVNFKLIEQNYSPKVIGKSLDQAPLILKLYTFPSLPEPNQSVNFVAFVLDDYDDSADLQMYWEFGDGNVSTNNQYQSSTPTSHTYTRPGEYIVSLTVTDSSGNVSVKKTVSNVMYRTVDDIRLTYAAGALSINVGYQITVELLDVNGDVLTGDNYTKIYAYSQDTDMQFDMDGDTIFESQVSPVNYVTAINGEGVFSIGTSVAKTYNITVQADNGISKLVKLTFI